MKNDDHNQPVEPRVTRYWRDPEIVQGCISEQRQLAAPDVTTYPHSERFEDELLALGINFHVAERAKKFFESFSAIEGQRQACEVIREMLLLLESTKLGKTPEFWAVLAILHPDDRQDEFAAKAGFSRQAFQYHLAKVRKLFLPATAWLKE